MGVRDWHTPDYDKRLTELQGAIVHVRLLAKEALELDLMRHITCKVHSIFQTLNELVGLIMQTLDATLLRKQVA